jgi:glycosyltransferase involved in cell wall biosynthesis
MNKPRPNISIIVPVYNVEKYLVRCLDSIFNQQFSGIFEVIAVEDASTDNGLQILKSYNEKESRLKIIEHGINKKLSIARATGMKVASGDYIMHVDSDDWLLPGALENLFKICIETNADVLVFNFRVENNEGKIIPFTNRIKKSFFTTNKIQVQNHFYGAVWNKIVKRTLTENLISGQVGVNNTEDLLYSSEILLKAEKIYLTPECFYVYFENSASLTRIVKAEDYLHYQILILDQLQKIVSKYKANLKLTKNLLNYFEKWIYLEFAKIHFWKNEDLSKSAKLVNELFQIPLMTPYRILRLKLSIKKKYFNLFEVTIRFGLKLSLGIILKSFRK